MGVPTVTGQYLIDLTNDLLGGYQGSVSSRALMSHINEGKDELWAHIKSLKDEYFQVSSQSTTPTGDFYFPQLTTGTRQYTLPADLRSIEYIEVTTPGYTNLTFRYAKMNSEDFRNARQQANTLGGPSLDQYNNSQELIYTIMGQDQFVLATYPPVNLNVTLWYTRGLPDYEMSDTISEILFPYSKKLAEYAANRVLLKSNPSAFALWKASWRDSLITVTQAAAERNDADATFVQEFWGDE